jgi:hypothetical protein
MVTCKAGENVEPLGANVESVGANVESHGANVESYGANVESVGANVESIEARELDTVADNKFACEKCKKTYVRKVDLTKHKRKCTGTTTTLQCELCHDFFATSSSKSHHKKTCKGKPDTTIEVHGSVSTQNNVNGTQNNVQIGTMNNTNNNITNNNTITINPIGRENLSHLTNEEILDIVLNIKDYTGVRKYLQWVHFNNDVKENQNVKLTDGYTNARSRESLVVMKTGANTWETTCQTAALKELLKSMTTHMIEWLHKEDTKEIFFCREQTDNDGMERILEIQEFMQSMRHANPNKIWYLRQMFNVMVTTMDKHLVEIDVNGGEA